MSLRLRTTLGLIAIGTLLLQGCEDDPVLGPTNEETGGGSYGRMFFVAPVHAGVASVEPAATNEAPAASRTNPTIF